MYSRGPVVTQPVVSKAVARRPASVSQAVTLPSLPHRGREGRVTAWLTLAGLLATALLTTGCVTTGPLEYIRNGFKVGPDYCRPPAPVAEDWIQANDPNVQNRHLEDWWAVFQDGTLDSLIDTAYRQNLNLRTLGTRVLQARARQAI